MPNDIAVAANINTVAGGMAILPSGTPTKRIPTYLIMLERKQGQKQIIEHFVSIDKPQSENGFLQAKGFYCNDKTEEEIVKGFNELLSTTPKENILEMMFPIHRIISVRSLVFNAVKSITQAIKQ